MRNVKIKEGAAVQYAIVADDAVIEEGAVVGAPPEKFSDSTNWGIAVVGQGARVRKGQKVLPKEMLAPGETR